MGLLLFVFLVFHVPAVEEISYIYLSQRVRQTMHSTIFKGKIRIIAQADDPQVVAYFLPGCRGLQEEIFTASTCSGVFAVLDDPERGASTNEALRISISSDVKIERRTKMASCRPRLRIIGNFHWMRTGIFTHCENRFHVKPKLCPGPRQLVY